MAQAGPTHYRTKTNFLLSLPQSWVYRCCCHAVLCGVRDQVQGSVHTRLVLYQLGYISILSLTLCCLMSLSWVQGEQSQKKLSSPRISCPQEAQAYGSYCYLLILEPQTWANAEIHCQKHFSGHLAFLLTYGEIIFVSSLVKNSLTTFPYIWIGLHDLSLGSLPNENGWKWSSSDPLTFYNWEIPPSMSAHHGYCAALSQASGYQKWRDYYCDTIFPYVCKFKG